MKYLREIIIMLLMAGGLIAAGGVGYKRGHMDGRIYGENAVYEWCYKNGGIMSSPTYPGTHIGCAALVETPKNEQESQNFLDKT